MERTTNTDSSTTNTDTTTNTTTNTNKEGDEYDINIVTPDEIINNKKMLDKFVQDPVILEKLRNDDYEAVQLLYESFLESKSNLNSTEEEEECANFTADNILINIGLAITSSNDVIKFLTFFADKVDTSKRKQIRSIIRDLKKGITPHPANVFAFRFLVIDYPNYEKLINDVASILMDMNMGFVEDDPEFINNIQSSLDKLNDTFPWIMNMQD